MALLDKFTAPDVPEIGSGGRPLCAEITKDGEIVWVLRDFRWLKECTAVQILDDPGDPEIIGDCER